MKEEIINVIAKLDNGSHSSNQLQGADEALFEIFKKNIEALRITEDEHPHLSERMDDFHSGFNTARLIFQNKIDELLK